MYLRNRTITKTCENKKPIEILLRRKPNINNLRLYGSIVFVRISEFKINSKWHKKADIGILVGYENVGYRILVKNKIIIARHVEFIGENDNLVGFQGMDESDNETEKDFEEHSDTNEIHESETSDEKVEQVVIKKERNLSNESEEKLEDMENNLRKPGRKTKKPQRYGQTSSYFIYANVISAGSPQTYEEALSGDDSRSWKEVMDREMNSLVKNKNLAISRETKR